MRIIKIKGKHIRKCTLETLFKLNLLSRHSTSVCNVCVLYTEEKLLKPKSKMNSASVSQNKKCFKKEQSDKSSTEDADMTEKVESDMDLNADLGLPLNMSTPQIVKFFVNAIENNKLSENEISEISFALGSSQSSAMQQSFDSCSSSFRDLDTLADTEGKLVDNILSKANPMLIIFLCGISALSKNSASDRVKKQYALVKSY